MKKVVRIILLVMVISTSILGKYDINDIKSEEKIEEGVEDFKKVFIFERELKNKKSDKEIGELENKSPVASCLNCTANGTCDLCEYGYLLNRNKTNEVKSPVAHCLNCTANGTCDLCEYGYLLNRNKTRCEVYNTSSVLLLSSINTFSNVTFLFIIILSIFVITIISVSISLFCSKSTTVIPEAEGFISISSNAINAHPQTYV